MSADTRRAILAFALAPLTAPVLWWMDILISGHSGAKGLMDVLDGLALVILAATPWIYGPTLAIGVPAFWAIRRWSRLRWWHSIAIAGFVGATVYPLTNSLPTSASTILAGATLGAATGVTFWLSWRLGSRRTPVRETSTWPER